MTNLNQAFSHPWLMFMLAILPALALLAQWSRHRRRSLVARLGPSSVIRSQTIAKDGRWRSVFGWTLGLAAVCIGSAGPRWGLGPAPATAPGRDIVVVLDLSQSMLAQDALPSRLGKAKEALRKFTDAVQIRGGHRLALVAFAGQGSVIVPLTHDYDHFRSKLAELNADPPPSAVRGSAVSGTRIGAGLKSAVELLDTQHRGAQEIILLSDGDDPANDDEWRHELAAARNAGIPVNVVGIGDPNHESPIVTAHGRLHYQGTEVHTRLHDDLLREIAGKTGGVYITALKGPARLDALFRDRISQGPTRESLAGTLPQPIGRQLVFLAAALMFIICAIVPFSPRAAARGFAMRSKLILSRIRRPATVVAALAMVSASPTTDWLRRGNEALTCGQPEAALAEYARAAECTSDPGEVAFNEGVALYRLGRYRDAEVRFRQSLSDAQGPRRVRALYNLGAALLQESQGRLKSPLKNAIECFEVALAETRPNDPLADDLRHNLEIAKRLLTQLPVNAKRPDETPDQPRSSPPPPGGTDQTDANSFGRQPSAGQRDPSGQPKPLVKVENDVAPQQTDRPPPPGKGNLPPLPDEDALTPLSPEDAQAHLQRAAERISEERNARLKISAPPPATKFPEW